jgi:RpiR family carbohydrate utilization transcriptional regulator
VTRSASVNDGTSTVEVEEKRRAMAGGLPMLTSILPNLRNAEQRVAEYVIANAEEVVYLSITDLAERSGTSEATVSRLCRRLGLKGYQELKISLAMSVLPESKYVYETVTDDDDVYTICSKVISSNIRGLQDTLSVLEPEQLEAAIGRLAKARRIEFYGTGGSAAVAKDAHHKFVKTGVPCVFYEDPHMQVMSASLLTPDDVVVAISYSGSNRDIHESIEVAREQGAFIILITGFARCPLARLSDITLWVSVGETFKSESARSRIAQLCVLDSLYIGVMLKRGDAGMESLRNTREAVVGKRF